MTRPNEAQITFWNAEPGERWAAMADTLDAFLAGLGEDLLAAAAPRPGERVLDIGCGAGATTLACAAAAGPSGQVTGIDVSRPLLTLARARAAMMQAPVRFLEADAATHDLVGLNADLLLSRFGVMFFDDPMGAFANIRQGARAGARLVFVCWRAAADNAWAMEPLLAALPHLPPFTPPAPGTPGPFALADAARTRAILTHAGFQDIAISPLDTTLSLGATPQEAAAMALRVGPAAAAAAEADEAARERALAAIADRFTALGSGGPVALSAACWLVSARV